MKLYALLLEHGVRVTAVDPDDWETEEHVENAFEQSGVRISRDKQLILAAYTGYSPDPVGGVYAKWRRDDDADAWLFDFDVAVAPYARGHGITGLSNTAPVGLRLIDAALETYKSERHDYGDRTGVSVYVINPKLIKVLERNYGFEIESEYSHGTAHMIKY